MDRTSAAIPHQQVMTWDDDGTTLQRAADGGECAAISSAQAAAAFADPEVRSRAQHRRVDLEAILEMLRLPPAARLAATPLVSTEEFWHLLAALRRHRARFVLIGGIAARLHGSTYGTGDFDICHARDGANLRALAAMLRELSAEYRRLPLHGPPVVEARIFATETDFVFTTRHGKFDLIGEFTGVGRYVDAAAGADEVMLGGASTRLLSLPKLIASKRSTGRPKDALVADELETILLIRERHARAE